MQVKKFYIRVLAILMAVAIAVTTPLSDFADIKGMKQTHAVAPALITLGGLFGAIAGAYGLYVAVDKLGDYAENWFNWTATNATDARTDLEKIRDGVTSFVISKAVMSSVADYMCTQESPTISMQVANKVVAPYDFIPVTPFSDSFEEYLADGLPLGECAYFVMWSPSSEYESGVYKVFIHKDLSNFYNSMGTMDNVDSYMGLIYPYVNGYYYTALCAYDVNGLPVLTKKDNMAIYDVYYADRWKYDSAGTFTNLQYQNFGKMNTRSLMPMVVSELSNAINSSLESVLDGTRNIEFVYDYKTHGSSALDNTNALEGQELTEAQLEAIHDAVEKEYSNVVQFPSNNENQEEPDTQALSNAVTLAVLNALQNMGYIKNPSDEPSGEDVKQELGSIKIAIDGLVDAISQINPLEKLQSIAEGIAELPQKITNSVASAFKNVMEELFTPDTEAMEEILNDFSDRFPWTTVLFDYSRDLGRIFDDSEPPKIYIHFQDSEDDRFHKVGTQVIFDASWYEPYKPTGDAILSVFIYAFFLWKLFKRIPSIISGEGMSVEVGGAE